MSYDLSKALFIATTAASFTLSGMILGISVTGVPAILESNNESFTLTAWRRTFNLGKSSAPPLAALSAAAALGAAYTHHHPQAAYRSMTFVASAVTTLSIIPFTLLFMSSTNSALFEREEAARIKAEKDGGSTKTTDETQRLIQKWRILNIVRSVLPFAGSLLAFEAL